MAANPPAFPRPIGHNGTPGNLDPRFNESQVGMTLRDYFAAAALPEVLASRVGNDAADIGQESIAEECYELADAMLAERERAS